MVSTVNALSGSAYTSNGVANLDVENFAHILDMVNDRQEAEEITLDDIADLRPPAYINRIASLQTFRCTNGREEIISNDPDYDSQSIHKLWTRVLEQGRITMNGTTGHPVCQPRSHTGTPCIYSPTHIKVTSTE